MKYTSGGYTFLAPRLVIAPYISACKFCELSYFCIIRSYSCSSRYCYNVYIALLSFPLRHI